MVLKLGKPQILSVGVCWKVRREQHWNSQPNELQRGYIMIIYPENHWITEQRVPETHQPVIKPPIWLGS
ncbi:hypothetical protein BH10CHL1_BH10CHL1_09420 [soil metagenome]